MQIEGQVIYEGIMLKSCGLAVAVSRSRDGSLIRNTFRLNRTVFHNILLIRPLVNLISNLLLQRSMNRWLAREYGNGRGEGAAANKNMANNLFYLMLFSFFIFLPYLAAAGIATVSENVLLYNFIAGAGRIILFYCYLKIISLSGGVKRIFQYHGAEHKVINGYLKNSAAAESSRFHPECGSCLLSFCLIFGIIFYTVFDLFFVVSRPSVGMLDHIALHLLIFPFFYAVAVETYLLIKNYTPALAVIFLTMPGRHLQQLTTVEPETDQLKLAEIALRFLQTGLRG